MPQKNNIPFTAGEVLANTASGILLGLYSSFYIAVLFDCYNVSTLLILCFSVLIFIALCLISSYPRLLNRSDSEEAEERDCRTIRRSCIAGNMIISTVFFISQIIYMGYIEMFFYNIHKMLFG